MLRAYKTEVDPNNKQTSLFMRYAGTARFVYNWALADRVARHEQGLSTNVYEQKRRFNALKDQEYPWIREVAYAVTDSAFVNLDIAYTNFFRRVRNNAGKKGFPKFKSRKRGIGAFTVRGHIHVEAERIKLPRIGWLKLKERRYLPVAGVRILSVNVSERAGRWFASMQVEMSDRDVSQASGKPIGIDLGLKVWPFAQTARYSTIPTHYRRMRNACTACSANSAAGRREARIARRASCSWPECMSGLLTSARILFTN